MPVCQNSKSIFNNSLLPTSELPSFNAQNNLIIYEVVRLIEKKILFQEDHIQRFFESFKHIEAEPGITKNEIVHHLALLIELNQAVTGNIKFQVVISSNSNKHDFYAFFIPHSYPTKEQYQAGVSVSVRNALRLNPHAKVQQSSLRTFCDEVLKEENTYEVILVNQKGFVTEGSRSNLFMIKNNVVITPQIEDILPGITRKYILQICNDLKIQCIQKEVSLNEMLGMDALFITGTSPKVLPIHSIYKLHFDVKHPLLRSIIKEFDKLIKNYLEPNIKFL